MQLHSEISKNAFKQICLLLLPGALVTIPLFILLYLSVLDSNFKTLLKYFESHHLLLFVFGLIFSFIMGFILENLGSNLEDFLDRKTNLELWEVYLDTKYNEKHDRIIFKYIDSVVFRYKMELSFAPAFLIVIIELFFIRCAEKHLLTPDAFFFIVSVFFMLLVFTLWHAGLSRTLLNSLRIKFFTYDENNKCKKCKNSHILNKCTLCGQ